MFTSRSKCCKFFDSQALRLRCIRRTSRTYAPLLTLGLRREFEPLWISIGGLFQANSELP